MSEQGTLLAESWGEKAHRLALEVKELTFDPFASSLKQREAYRRKKYELQLHLENVE